MKTSRKQLKRIIREALEQVDWDNPQGSWDSNDQENWENEQERAGQDSEILNPLELKWFYDWIEGDNATEVEPDVWIEQSTQYRVKFTFKELQEFFKETYVPLGIPDHIRESMKITKKQLKRIIKEVIDSAPQIGDRYSMVRPPRSAGSYAPYRQAEVVGFKRGPLGKEVIVKSLVDQSASEFGIPLPAFKKQFRKVRMKRK